MPVRVGSVFVFIPGLTVSGSGPFSLTSLRLLFFLLGVLSAGCRRVNGLASSKGRGDPRGVGKIKAAKTFLVPPPPAREFAACGLTLRLKIAACTSFGMRVMYVPVLGVGCCEAGFSFEGRGYVADVCAVDGGAGQQLLDMEVVCRAHRITALIATLKPRTMHHFFKVVRGVYDLEARTFIKIRIFWGRSLCRDVRHL